MHLPSVRSALLVWFERAARALPWRATRDPYAIWVSEVMLQQTRVDAVVPYYLRFLARFPSTEALARATEDEVMAAFSGLGYYRRARLLHAGVREVVARYGGQVPSDASARRALPGIGRYTAGAIGSIAFDLPEPIVDGNVARVLCRLLALDQAPEDRARQALLWQTAEALAQGPRPGALNQALMELGATVCTKHAPSCERCPIAKHCAAKAQGRTEELPRARTRKPPRPTKLVALLACTRDGALWLQRGERGLFAGLWNLPLADGHGRAVAAALREQLGIGGRLAAKSSGGIEHVLTHRRLDVELWSVSAANAQPTETLRAVVADALDELGVSRLTHKALAQALPQAALDTAPSPRHRARTNRSAR